MTTLSTPAIAALRAMIAAATPGPWSIVRQAHERWIDTLDYHSRFDPERGDTTPTVCEMLGTGDQREANASLIVVLHNAAGALLDELETLRAALAHLRASAGHAAAVAVHGDPLAGAVGTINPERQR